MKSSTDENSFFLIKKVQMRIKKFIFSLKKKEIN